jgi:ribonucleoside-diphosphate reductase alpha chain
MFSETQLHYFNDRYALKDANGQPLETQIPEMWGRVARAIADNEHEADSFYRILSGFRFIPGGRILAGAGAETEKTFYNCYVIPLEAKHETDHYPKDYPGNDSRESIFHTMQTMVDIMSRGGGVGVNWSVLRPSGAYLRRISGWSSGPVGWMDVASAAVGEVIQGGSRRGAAMFMLDDWHPDILDFIEAKKDPRKITNANVSVAISDAFMEAVENDEDWNLIFPDTDHPTYNREWDGDIEKWQSESKPVRVYATVKASDIWRAITDAAWASGEPGVVFLDRYNKQSTARDVERLISVNPCGEQGLGAYSVCNLGAMNLDAYVRTIVHKTRAMGFSALAYHNPMKHDFDWEGFRYDVATAIRFLDNVVDKNHYFLPQNKSIQLRLRRIGLSVTGLADCLVRLGIRYGSPESVEFVEEVFRTMKDTAIRTSMNLAREKGPAPAWDDSMWTRPYLQEWLQRTHWKDGQPIEESPSNGLRNLFLLTQAPTGTTSLLANVNSGIEPYFSLKTWREDRTGGRYVYAEAVKHIVDTGELPDYVVTAADVTVDEHIAIQAAVQRYCDSSVSKTINAPNSQTPEETAKAYTLAYQSGLKGIAYYRDGSRNVQVLYNEDPNVTIARLEAKVKELAAQLATGLQGDISISEMPTFGQDLCPACNVGIILREEGCYKCGGAEGSEPCGWSAC